MILLLFVPCTFPQPVGSVTSLQTVCQHMRLQMVYVCKGFVTQWTLERPFANVFQHVHPQVTRLKVRLLTHATLQRALIRVGPHVSL